MDKELKKQILNDKELVYTIRFEKLKAKMYKIQRMLDKTREKLVKISV